MIRRATKADMPRVWQLLNELAEFERLGHAVTGSLELLEKHLDHHFECFVVDVEGTVVSYALTYTTYSTFLTLPGMWLEDLFVTPEHRGTGIGKQMLQFLMEDSKQRGFGRLEWSVLDWNQNAIDFYERMGATILPDWKTCRISIPTKTA